MEVKVLFRSCKCWHSLVTNMLLTFRGGPWPLSTHTKLHSLSSLSTFKQTRLRFCPTTFPVNIKCNNTTHESGKSKKTWDDWFIEQYAPVHQQNICHCQIKRFVYPWHCWCFTDPHSEPDWDLVCVVKYTKHSACGFVLNPLWRKMSVQVGTRSKIRYNIAVH